MKILMVTSAALPPEEGVGTYVVNLSKELQNNGYDVTILTRGSKEFCTIGEQNGIKFIKAMFLPVYPYHVHLHSIFCNLVLDNKQFDIIHYHTPLPAVLNLNAPSILTVHTPMKADSRHVELINLFSIAVKLQAFISIRIEKKLFKKSEIITAVARSVAGELTEYGLEEKDIKVLGNGVDTEYFHKGEESKPPYLLYVGRLGFRKGLFDLIEAMSLLVRENLPVKLLIAGKGPLENEIKKRITNLDLGKNVSLVGHIDRSSKNTLLNLYQGASVFVQPSHYEGLPTTLLEAMSCGCAVVSTAVSGSLDVVEDNMNGLLVPPKNPAEMAKAVKKLILDMELRSRLGNEARKTIERGYSWKTIAKRYMELYEGLVH